MTLRRFFTIFLLLLLLGGIATGGVYLYTFDLNSFRTEIETLASEQISRPLTLGNAHLSLKHGPAFAFDNLTIGTKEDDFYLSVDKVFFRVQTLPLLSGEILFSEILLEKPVCFVKLKPSGPDETLIQDKPNELFLSKKLINSLRVLGGTIRVKDERKKGSPEELTIEKLRFSIDDFSLSQAGNFMTEATLLYRGTRSPLTLEGDYNQTEAGSTWDHAFYRFKLNIKNIGAKNLSRWLQSNPSKISLDGSANLTLQVDGIPQEGVSFGLKVTGNKLNLRSSPSSSLPISEAELSGRIQYEKERVTLEESSLRVETGRGRLESKNQALFTLKENSVSSIASNGTLSATLFPDDGQTGQPFFTRNLTASYKTNLLQTKTGWSATNGELLLPGLKLLFDGEWERNSQNSFALNLAIPETPFSPVLELFPGLKKLEELGLSGSFNSRIRLKRSSDRGIETIGRLNLTDVHLGIPGPLADLSGINGSIELQNRAIMAKGLKAELGSSPISVDLTIPDMTAPDTTLHVRGDSIRADELIFTSDKRYLKQVDGIVRIADGTVFLGPIHVKMEGGTDATVNGRVQNFSAPDVSLQIVGRHGNIDEIIDLWEHPSVTPIPQPIPHPPRKGSLLIDIVTDSGQISGMQFDRATSQITQRNNTLIIGPIRFKTGAGEGLGQVLIVHQKEGPSLLKISGNLKDFDARTVYQQLLKRQGLVTGKLSGDFFLEGVAGEQFLPTSNGAFSVKIEDGRLQKLTGLAKILQILNLYPMLTENIQGKGLPYDTIIFNTTLSHGTLETEDFLLQGGIMNLSLTGQYNIIDSTVDLDMGAMPLRSVDSILSHIPIAGWLLTGSDKALVIAYFKMTGPANDPEVKSVPLDSVTTPVIGILKRVFSFPVKIITDPGEAFLNQ